MTRDEALTAALEGCPECKWTGRWGACRREAEHQRTATKMQAAYEQGCHDVVEIVVTEDGTEIVCVEAANKIRAEAYEQALDDVLRERPCQSWNPILTDTWANAIEALRR